MECAGAGEAIDGFGVRWCSNCGGLFVSTVSLFVANCLFLNILEN